MANVVNGNSIYVDATGSLLTSKSNKVIKIWFTPDAANDELLIKDADNSGNSKIYLRGATAKNTLEFDFGPEGILFPNGIHVSTLTSGAKAIILLNRGASG